MRRFIRALSGAANDIYQSQQGPVEATKAQALTVVVATMAAYKLPIPSSEVDRPQEWYIQNALSSVEQFIGMVNEQIVLDASTAAELAKAIWESRYATVHVPTSKEAIGTILSIMGNSNYRIPPVYAESLTVLGRDDLVELMYHANEFCEEKDLFQGA